MSEFGVNPTGFKLKRLADIREDVQARLNLITDPVSGETLQVDLQEDDPLVQAINATLDEIALVHQIAQEAYNQFDPSRSTGSAFQGLIQLNGITLREGTFSRAPITITGDANTIIPQGSQISNTARTVTFQTESEYTIGVGGTVDGFATAIEIGSVQAAINTLTNILNPVTGWSTVTNTAAATVGTDPETEAEARQRRNRSTENPSVTIVEAIRSNIAALDGVSFARVYVNNTITTDARGFIGKSIAPVVVGGDQREIAEVLLLRTPAGIRYNGDVNETFIDAQGSLTTVSFYRPTEIRVIVQVDVDRVDLSQFPSNGEQLIKDNIEAYALQGISGIGITSNNFEQSGFVPGEDILLTRLYTPVNAVPGHVVTNLQIAVHGSPLGNSDIDIGILEIGRIAADDVTVNVT
jgi:uncharacterized phage protein gp47/JayE